MAGFFFAWWTMDLSTRVDNEILYPLELRDPVTDEPIGVTMQIRSAGSDAAKKVLREHTDRNIIRRLKNKTPTSQVLEREELEKAASYIASWDWGDNTWQGEKPAFSMRKAVEIMDHPNGGWIYAQVAEAATKVENFTSTSEPVSADT